MHAAFWRNNSSVSFKATETSFYIQFKDTIKMTKGGTENGQTM